MAGMGNHIMATTALTAAVITTYTAVLAWVLAADERRHNRRIIAQLKRPHR